MNNATLLGFFQLGYHALYLVFLSNFSSFIWACAALPLY